MARVGKLESDEEGNDEEEKADEGIGRAPSCNAAFLEEVGAMGAGEKDRYVFGERLGEKAGVATYLNVVSPPLLPPDWRDSRVHHPTRDPPSHPSLPSPHHPSRDSRNRLHLLLQLLFHSHCSPPISLTLPAAQSAPSRRAYRET